MTIDKLTLFKGVRQILNSLNGKIMDGIVFNGEYMSAMNEDGYERVKLPCYIPDSFVIPKRILREMIKLPNGMLTIRRTEKYMEIEADNVRYVYSFTTNSDIDADIQDYDY